MTLPNGPAGPREGNAAAPCRREPAGRAAPRPRRTGPARGGEAGLSLVETLIGATILVVVVTMAFVASVTSDRVTVRTVDRGTAMDRAMSAAAALQALLAAAVDPAALPSGTTSHCSGSATGAAFPAGQGPFVATGPTSLALCTLPAGSTTAVTVDLQFSSCTASAGCTLTATRWPPVGGTGTTTVFSQSGLSDATAPTAPFAYDQATAAGWSTATTPGAVQAVQLTTTAVTDGATATIQRVVVLPNTIPGTDGADT